MTSLAGLMERDVGSQMAGWKSNRGGRSVTRRLWSALLLCPLAAWAGGTVTLSWEPAFDPDVVGYEIHYGTVSHRYTHALSVGSATSGTISGLVQGHTYYFSVTSYNSFGAESVFSDELVYRYAPEPPATVQGSFYGLFHEPDQVRQGSAGAVFLSTTRQGHYSGYLQLGNSRLPFQGVFNAQGQATNNLARRDRSRLALQFTLVGGLQSDQLQGTVAGNTWTANLSAERAPFHAKSSPAPLSGAYTLVIAGPDSNNPAVPFGHSFGLVRVDGAGRVRLAASLADGSRVSQSAPLSAQGLWGLYAPLYGGQGSLLAWLSFTNRPADDLNGTLNWLRPANPSGGYYPSGFNSACQTLGSRYTAARNPLGLTNLTVSFSGGELPANFTSSLAFTSAGRLAMVSTNPLQFSLSRATGLFRGSVAAAPAGGRRPFLGVLFQKAPAGYGFLLGAGHSSRVVLSP